MGLGARSWRLSEGHQIGVSAVLGITLPPPISGCWSTSSTWSSKAALFLGTSAAAGTQSDEISDSKKRTKPPKLGEGGRGEEKVKEKL